MPSLVLATRERMHVQDCVDSFRSTCFDDSIDQTEATLLDLEVFGIVHKMAVVDRHSDAIQSQRGEELGICSREEVIEKFVEEVVVLFLAEDAEQSRSHFVFVAWVSSDEVLHTTNALICEWFKMHCNYFILQMTACGTLSTFLVSRASTGDVVPHTPLRITRRPLASTTSVPCTRSRPPFVAILSWCDYSL